MRDHNTRYWGIESRQITLFFLHHNFRKGACVKGGGGSLAKTFARTAPPNLSTEGLARTGESSSKSKRDISFLYLARARARKTTTSRRTTCRPGYRGR